VIPVQKIPAKGIPAGNKPVAKPAAKTPKAFVETVVEEVAETSAEKPKRTRKAKE
jgi:hypothetical protein